MNPLANLKSLSQGKIVKSAVRGFQKFKISFSIIVSALFAVIVILEFFLGYNYLYKNLLFSEPEVTETDPSIVRINFGHYNQVVGRLDRVAGFYATSTIDFTGAGSGAGRSNPFANPE